MWTIKKQFKAIILLVLFFVSAPSAHASLTPNQNLANKQQSGLSSGLVGYWTMDGKDINNNVTALDKSGNNNNGTLTNGPTKATGKIGQALKFDGVDDYVINNSTSAGNLTNGTISAWVNPSVFTGGSACNIHNTSGACRAIAMSFDFGYFFGVNSDGALFLDLGNAGGTDWGVIDNTSANAVALNSWQYVTVTVSGTSVKYYVNGALFQSNTVAANNGLKLGTQSRLILGGDSTVTTWYFPGSLDDVRIYNRALSASEVGQLYNLGR